MLCVIFHVNKNENELMAAADKW